MILPVCLVFGDLEAHAVGHDFAITLMYDIWRASNANAVRFLIPFTCSGVFSAANVVSSSIPGTCMPSALYESSSDTGPKYQRPIVYPIPSHLS